MSLPNEYIELEYIQSDGNQYIDLGFKADYNTTKIEIKLNSQYVSGTSAIFGSEWAMSGYFLMFINDNIRWHSASSVDVPCQLNTDYVIQTTKDNVVVNGQSYSVSPSSVLTNYNLRLYDTSGGYGSVKGKFKTYYLKVWDNDVLIRDFIPVINKSDLSIGLYDLVNDQFYTNSGTGTFTGKFKDTNDGMKLYGNPLTFTVGGELKAIANFDSSTKLSIGDNKVLFMVGDVPATLYLGDIQLTYDTRDKCTTPRIGLNGTTLQLIGSMGDDSNKVYISIDDDLYGSVDLTKSTAPSQLSVTDNKLYITDFVDDARYRVYVDGKFIGEK